MEKRERKYLIIALREALQPFRGELKGTLKAEMRVDLLEPVEMRLRSGMGRVETLLSEQLDELGARMTQFELDVADLGDEVVRSFVQTIGAQHTALTQRLDRLEHRAAASLDGDQDEARHLTDVSNNIVAIRQRLENVERILNDRSTYKDIAQIRFALAEGYVIGELVDRLEEQADRLA